MKELVHPYLLSGIEIVKPHQVWQVDIAYLRTTGGFVYLVALIDVYSRLVVGWRLSNSLCTESCILALQDAIDKYGKPDIINRDQGSQFTSDLWIEERRSQGVKIGMTGKGRCNDNANIERLWRSFKYEGSYLYNWYSISELKENIPRLLAWYNGGRPHQALGYKTPLEIYCGFMDKSYDLHTIPQLQQLQNLDNLCS